MTSQWRPSFRRPAFRRVAIEPTRAALELASTAGAFGLLQFTPRGDGHTVLVLPGFMAGERSTAPMRTYLGSRGYKAVGWKLGRNLGPTPAIVRGLDRRLAELAERSGQRVSLVGWSLGGIYARSMALRHADRVRNVVTLGSPVRLTDSSASNADGMFQYLRPYHLEDHPGVDGGAPLEMPATSAYTRADAIVPWRSCLIDEDHQSENVQVLGSHTGLGFNPAALFLLADRLAQPEGAWRPFRAPARARLFFPEQATTR